MWEARGGFKASPSSIYIYTYINTYIYIIKKKFVKPVQHTLRGFYVFCFFFSHKKFKKPVKGTKRELKLVFRSDIKKIQHDA